MQELVSIFSRLKHVAYAICPGEGGRELKAIEEGTKSQERGGAVRGQSLGVSLGSLTQISHTELIVVENNGHRASSNPSCRSLKEKI